MLKRAAVSAGHFTCAGRSAKQVDKTKQGRKKQALPSPICRHGEIGDRAALPTQRMRVRAPLSAFSRFSSAGRASALQAEGPRFDPWNRDENSFPIRLGESTPLTRRPKGKRLVPVFGKCGHGAIGSIPVFQTGGAGSFPVVHFPPSWLNWKSSCFVISRFPVQARMTACGLSWRGSTAAS